MIKNLKILFLSILLFFLTIKVVLSESLQDLAKELNSLREQISQLPPPDPGLAVVTVINKSGKVTFGRILNSSEGSKVVTFIDSSTGKMNTGVLIGDATTKQIQASQHEIRVAEAAAEQINAVAKIDIALKSVDQATAFMQESYAKGDIDAAIAALAVIDVAMSDVANNVPYDFRSQVIKEGENFTKDEMQKISSITKNINNKKNKNYEELKEYIETAKTSGLDVEEITKKIISSGIKTPKLNDYYKQASNEELRRNLSDSIKYSGIIGKSPDEVDLSVRQAAAFQSGDPKKIRAIEIEKFGIAAGLSKDMINKGINAVYNGDIEFEKQITKTILNKLKSNKNYSVSAFSDAEINGYMQEQIATEKAAYKILNSGIDFSSGTSQSDVNKLADEIENILNGNVDKSKIQQIKYNISRTQFEITSKENVAANLIAEINGQDYVDALVQMNIGSKSIAEQAAVFEAGINGNMEAFREVTRSTNKASLNNMSLSEVNELTKVYNAAIYSNNLSKQVRAETEKIEAAIGRAKSEIFDEANAELEKNIKRASEAMHKGRAKTYFDKDLGIVINTYDHTTAMILNRQWQAAIQKQRDLRDGTIKADFALIEAKEFAKIDAANTADAATKAAQIATDTANTAQDVANKAADKAAEAAKKASESATEESKAAAAEAKAAAEKAAAEAKAASKQAAKAAAEKVASQAAKVAATQAAKAAAEKTANVAAAQAAAESKAASKAVAAQAKATSEKATAVAKSAATQAASQAKSAATQAASQAKAAAEEAVKAATEQAKAAAADAAKLAIAQAKSAAKQVARETSRQIFNEQMQVIEDLRESKQDIYDVIYGAGKNSGDNRPTDEFRSMSDAAKTGQFNKLKEIDNQINKARKKAHGIE